jgi:hypothetical protein
MLVCEQLLLSVLGGRRPQRAAVGPAAYTAHLHRHHAVPAPDSAAHAGPN